MKIILIFAIGILASCTSNKISYTNYCSDDPRILAKYEKLVMIMDIKYKVQENEDWSNCIVLTDTNQIDNKAINMLANNISKYKEQLSVISVFSGDVSGIENLLIEKKIPYESTTFHGKYYVYWDQKYDNSVSNEIQEVFSKNEI